jgi:MinD-like ATPase involved in chromosome partitioning or flagellar assembly
VPVEEPEVDDLAAARARKSPEQESAEMARLDAPSPHRARGVNRPPRPRPTYNLQPLVAYFVMVVLGLAIGAAHYLYGMRSSYGFVLLAVWVWAVYVFLLQKRFKGLSRTLVRPTPTMGWQKWVRRVLQVLRINYVPAFSIDEQIDIEGVRHRGHRNTKRAEVGVFGPKGGVGKSTVATILAFLSVMFSQNLTLLCDVRQKRGNLAERFGLTRRNLPRVLTAYTTITLRQAIELFKAGYFWNAAQVQTIIGSVPGTAPLQVIASIMGGKSVRTAFNKADLAATLDELRNTYTLVIHEAPDELEDMIDLELMRRIDFPIFVHRVNMTNSEEELLDALRAYMTHPEFQEKILKHGRLLVLGTRKNDTKEKFGRMFGINPEHVFLVPFSNFYEPSSTRKEDSGKTIDLMKADEGEDGHDDVANVDKPPKPALNIAKMPRKALLEYLRCLNSGLESLPPEVLTARPPVESDAPHQKGSES